MILFCGIAYSQVSRPSLGTIKGEVISRVDNSPVLVGYIKLRWTGLQAEIDSRGKFSLDSISFSQYHLEVHAWGYEMIDTLVTINDTIPKMFKFSVYADCDSIDANRDIAQGKPRLLLIGSIAPTCNSSQDSLFEKQYGVLYYDFGCQPPADTCIKKYNLTIFQYLDKIFGEIWRKQIRQDVCFLK